MADKYIEIQNRKNQALLALISCNSATKSGDSHTEKCVSERNNFNNLLKDETELDLKINSQSENIMTKVTDVTEKTNTLRSQYPSCN